jgi:hypothetical protein
MGRKKTPKWVPLVLKEKITEAEAAVLTSKRRTAALLQAAC